MKKRSLRFTCCHEAGHAVVAHRNNYQISGIQISCSVHPVFDDPESDPCVRYEPQEWGCSDCGGSVIDRNDPGQLSKLSDGCPTCKEEKMQFIERCSAGYSATELLEPSEHEEDGERACEWDNEQIGEVYPTQSQARQDAFKVGRERATHLVCQSRDAVIALRDQLELNQDMSGTEAVTIISAALITVETDNG